MIDAVERLISNTDRSLVSSATAIDLSKVFDSVDHDALLTKLPWYGITDVSWFSSYLSNRTQIVRGGGTTLPVTCGVPQGSIIGPIIFILFISDLPAHITHGSLISYADDTLHVDCAVPDGPCLAELRRRLELNMHELHAWFGTNSLKMNSSKSDFMIVGNKNAIKKFQNFCFTVSESSIQPSKAIKLSVSLRMSWEGHISQVQKCNNILLSLYRFRHYFTSNALKIIVQTYVFPTSCTACACGVGRTRTRCRNFKNLLISQPESMASVKKQEHVTPTCVIHDKSG